MDQHQLCGARRGPTAPTSEGSDPHLVAGKRIGRSCPGYGPALLTRDPASKSGRRLDRPAGRNAMPTARRPYHRLRSACWPGLSTGSGVLACEGATPVETPNGNYTPLYLAKWPRRPVLLVRVLPRRSTRTIETARNPHPYRSLLLADPGRYSRRRG